MEGNELISHQRKRSQNSLPSSECSDLDAHAIL